MKGIVIYQGKYGATQQYAEWLGQELNIPVVSADDEREEISNYDYFVLGSSVYIGKLVMRNWLKKNLANINTRKIFFFLVSGTAPDEKEKLESYLSSGIPATIRKKIDVSFLPGKLDIKKLSWMDRFLLRMGARLEKDAAVKKGMLTEYNQVKKENLAGLIDKVKNFVGKPITV